MILRDVDDCQIENPSSNEHERAPSVRARSPFTSAPHAMARGLPRME